MRKPSYLILSATAWGGFNLVMIWLVGFLAGAVVPVKVDGPARTSTAVAVVIDVASLLLFAVQHSVMARAGVKARMRRFIPVGLERTVYVFTTDVCLVAMLVLWQPFGGRLWDVGGVGAVALWVLFAAGWLLAGAATYAVDHFELTGLRQAGWLAPLDAAEAGALQLGGLHALVRHPLMTGLIIAFWATPRMGASHLLFAIAASAYIAVGIRFEERDLRRTFGDTYEQYAETVPALVPAPRRRHQRTG